MLRARSRRTLCRSPWSYISAPVATLTTVAFLASLAPVRVAHASVEETQPVDTPNFSEATNGVHGGVDNAQSTAKATKARTAPVSARGAFTHSIGIQVPPGRLGQTPALSLSYDSGSVTESAVGVGWSLNMPMIARSTRDGFPKVQGPDSARTYDDSSAVFTSPSGELVAATDGPAGASRVYAPARETSAVRYEYLPAQGGSFVEHLPSGKKRYYGRDPFTGRTARIVNELGTHAWLLVRDEDAYGNDIKYYYHNTLDESRPDKRKAGHVPILSKVEWGGNRKSGQASCFYVQTFLEGQTGPVNLLEGNTLLDDRVKEVDVVVDGVISWRYYFDYTVSPETGKSLLSRVRKTGDTSETSTFTYSAGAPASGPRFLDMGAIDQLDPIYTNDSHWRQEQSPYEPERSSPELAVQAPGYRSGVKFIDVDGNGTTDAIYHAAGIGTTATHVLWEESMLQGTSSTGLGAWTLPALGASTIPSMQPTTGLPFFPVNGTWTRSDFAAATLQDLADLDGDGDADALALPLDVAVVPGRNASPLFPPPPYFGNAGLPAGQMKISLKTNTARSSGVQLAAEQFVTGWPFKVTLNSYVYATVKHVGSVSSLKYSVEPRSDVQMPIVDLNADGRSDVVLLKHRAPMSTWDPGWAVALPPWGMMRLYGGMSQQQEGDVVTTPLEQTIRGYVHAGAVVLVDETLLTPKEAPSLYVVLQTTADGMGIPELPPATRIVLFSAPGHIPAPGYPGGEIPGVPPQERPKPPIPDGIPWWAPIVDPEGDVFLPLRDGDYAGGGGSGSLLFFGGDRFVPRAYLMRGDATRALVAEPDENSSNFERSLQALLNAGQSEECSKMACVAGGGYPPHVNFNSFFADVNGDGLPDLIAAAKPTARVDSQGRDILTCQEGHDVYLNRGYAFEMASGETITQSWSSGDPNSALGLVANRDRFCTATRPAIEDRSNLSFSGVPIPTYPISSMAQADVNGDGRLDIVFAHQPNIDSNLGDTGLLQQVFVNTGRGFVAAPWITLPSSVAITRSISSPGLAGTAWPHAGLADLARFVDLDNDGLVDIVTAGMYVRTGLFREQVSPAKWYRNRGTLPDRLERIDTSSGAWTQIEYDSPKSSTVQLPPDGLRPPATMRVVKTIRSASGPVPTPAGYDPFPVQETRVSYENFVRDIRSNEFIGFEKIKTDFVNSFDGTPRETVRVTRTYDVRPELTDAGGAVVAVRHPLKGAVLSVVTETGGWTATESYDYKLEARGAGVRIRPLRTLHGDTSPSGATEWSAEETTAFDSFGNPTMRITGNYDGTTVSPWNQRRTTTTEYENRTDASWQIGLVTRQKKRGYDEDILGNADYDHLLSEVATTYDTNGSVKSSTRVNIRDALCPGPADDVTTFEYWPHGLVRAVHEANGRDVMTTYDTKNLYAARVETQVGRMVSGVFTPKTTTLARVFATDLRSGQPTSSTDPSGIVTSATYDDKGRVITRSGPSGQLESHTYRDDFPVSHWSTFNTNTGDTFTRVTNLDADGHVLSTVERATSVPPSRTTKIRYDAFGRAVESYLPAFASSLTSGPAPASGPKVVTSYDGFDRITLVVKADGATYATAYEPRATVETNPRGIETLRGYDAFGDLIYVGRNVANEDHAENAFRRDGRGEIVIVWDADGGTRRIARDGGGRTRYVTLPTWTDPPTQKFAMCHNFEDKLVRLDSPSGRAVEITYDELGRPLVSRATDQSGLVVETTQVYDDASTPRGIGRVTSKTDESGVYRLGYDINGRPSTVTFEPSARARAGATTVAASYTANFDYSVAGHLKSVSLTGLPQAAGLTYSRDEKGRVVGVVATTGTSTTSLAADIVYDAAGRITKTRFGNGTSGEWTYNPLSERLDAITHRTAANAILAAAGYVYDANGNILEESRQRGGSTGIYSQKLHTYSQLDRLATSEVSHPNGNQYENYWFTPAGNLMSTGAEEYAYASPVTTQAVSSINDVWGPTGSHRELTYDADGYLASDYETRGDSSHRTRTLTFDPTGCLRRISSDGVAANGAPRVAISDYTCGLDGRVVARSTMTADGTRSRRIDFAGLAEIRPDEGLFVLRVPLSGSVSAEDARSLSTGARVVGASGYVFADARGSELATTAFDSDTVLTREAEYDAWGRKLTNYTSLSTPRHGFAGAEADAAVGTYTFGARTYDPTLRRWISPDPLLVAAPHLDEAIGENLNLYGYAEGNPVNRIDLTGFEGDSLSERLQNSRFGMAITGFAFGLAQGTALGGVLMPTPPSVSENPHAAVFVHWQSAGQFVGGTVSVAQGVVEAHEAPAATVVGGGVAGVAVSAHAAAMIANGVAAIGKSFQTAQEAQAKGDAPSGGGTTKAEPAEAGKADARFVGQPDGKLVDTKATPKGAYVQPNGDETHILQNSDHGAGLSHTHEAKMNTDPKTGKTFQNGLTNPGRPVSAQDVDNIKSGATTPAKPRGRS